MTITDENAGTIQIGERKVRRLGFGAMRITGAASGARRLTTMTRSRSSAARSSWA